MLKENGRLKIVISVLLIIVGCIMLFITFKNNREKEDIFEDSNQKVENVLPNNEDRTQNNNLPESESLNKDETKKANNNTDFSNQKDDLSKKPADDSTIPNNSDKKLDKPTVSDNSNKKQDNFNNSDNNDDKSDNNDDKSSKDESHNSIIEKEDKPVPSNCVSKKFLIPWFIPDFDTMEKCQKKGNTYMPKYGYYCNFMQDDCGKEYYMLELFDENGTYHYTEID